MFELAGVPSVKAPDTRPDDLNAIPGTHTVEEGNCPCTLNSDLHVAL